MLVELKNVSRHFTVGSEKIAALANAYFEVESGQFACVFGASGSGKTTLAHVISGIEQPDDGVVCVAGQDLAHSSEATRSDFRLQNIGVIAQTNNLLPEFSALENVALPLLARRHPAPYDTAAAALDAVGLASLGSRRPAAMSGGQRQRVGVARAIAGRQPLLVADEPTGALDAENSRKLFSLMREMCDERGVAVVLATHDPIAREYGHVAYHMVDGTLDRR